MRDNFFNLSAETQSALISKTSEQLNMPTMIIEKDLWVCWLLEKIFALPVQMAFKGGTSLSKVFSLIKRFSEDCDVTIDYHNFKPDLDLEHSSKTQLTQAQIEAIKIQLKICWDYAAKTTARDGEHSSGLNKITGAIGKLTSVALGQTVFSQVSFTKYIVRYCLFPPASAAVTTYLDNKIADASAKAYELDSDIKQADYERRFPNEKHNNPFYPYSVAHHSRFLSSLRVKLIYAKSFDDVTQTLNAYCDFAKNKEHQRNKTIFTNTVVTIAGYLAMCSNYTYLGLIAASASTISGMLFDFNTQKYPNEAPLALPPLDDDPNEKPQNRPQ